ncbi:hypothetical protein S2E19_05594 [Bacillus mycoides]|nr:hypothetical protein S2E19_05594 [Bacillus mycoides]
MISFLLILAGNTVFGHPLEKSLFSVEHIFTSLLPPKS